jgi:hypothetical protein
MAISRKIDKIIQQGGEVKTATSASKEYKVLCQKIRLDILSQVDRAVDDRAGMNRNAWIQEAIQEKLKRLNDVR